LSYSFSADETRNLDPNALRRKAISRSLQQTNAKAGKKIFCLVTNVDIAL